MICLVYVYHENALKPPLPEHGSFILQIEKQCRAKHISIGECNTILSAYTKYRPLG